MGSTKMYPPNFETNYIDYKTAIVPLFMLTMMDFVYMFSIRIRQTKY